MTFHDWINNIRWKYFTNNKSGLIFKETTKEFGMVYKMTENKRYYIGNGENCTICDSNRRGSDFYNMLTQFEAVDRLNEQEERIQEYKHLVKIATNLIEWNTIPQIRREWQNYLNKVGDV